LIAAEVKDLHDVWMPHVDETAGRVVGQAKRFSQEINDGVKRCTDVVEQVALEGQRQILGGTIPRVQQVMRQTVARIFEGDSRSEGKIVSVFEPSAEVIRRGKASKPTEFGKLIKLQEAENQIVIDYQVYEQRPSDTDLLIPAIDAHEARLGRLPRLVAADAGFYSARNETEAKAKGVKRICIPNYASKSAVRRREQKKRWFRDGHQRRQTPPRPQPPPIPRGGRNEALGRPRGDRRQPDQLRPGDRQTVFLTALTILRPQNILMSRR
jgi:transposase, IS5 family